MRAQVITVTLPLDFLVGAGSLTALIGCSCREPPHRAPDNVVPGYARSAGMPAGGGGSMPRRRYSTPGLECGTSPAWRG